MTSLPQLFGGYHQVKDKTGEKSTERINCILSETGNFQFCQLKGNRIKELILHNVSFFYLPFC